MTLNFVEENFYIGQKSPDLSPQFIFYKRGFRLGGSSGGGWKEITISGIGAVTLVNAIDDGLLSLTLYGDTEQLPETYLDTVTLSGGCEQNDTPSPDTPIDIVCNNGAIKVSPNLFNKNDLYSNHYITSSGGIGEANTWDVSAKIPVTPNTNYTLSGVIQVYPGISHAFFNSSDEPVSIIQAAVGTTVLTAPANASYLRLSIRKESGDKNTVQLEQGSTATTYMPYGQIYTQGTVETVTDSNGLTANAERLLAVGTYKDTQEVLTGTVSRNVGIKVLDGTENWTKGTSFYTNIEAISDALQATHTCICTHYQGISTDIPSAGDSNNIKVGSNVDPSTTYYGRIYVYADRSLYATAQDFANYLASQYASGTPVIIVYPLETATTESATPQLLQKSPVTQTAGSISNLPIAITESQKTVPTPQQPLPINCNNGVLGIDSQGNITVTGTTETVEITGKNLFDKTAVTQGYIYNAQLEYVSSEFGSLSDYIAVKAGETYTLSCISSLSSYNQRVNFFNSSKEIQSQVVQATGTGDFSWTITIPNNISYIRYSFRNEYIDTQQLELGSTATTYEPYYNGGTATAENLFKIGDYKDEQEVLTGDVTRNVGVKVLDGSEDWVKSGNYAGAFYFTYSASYNPVQFVQGVCTHARWVDSNSFTRNTCYNGSAAFIIWNGNFNASSTIEEWKSWLATQYNSGTPVILVYPLATPTTETVTAQPMTVRAGTNTVEITQSAIDNLGLEVSYKAVV